MWETVVIFLLFDHPAIVVKKELGVIPLYGWLVRKVGTILVDRKAHAKALKNMAKQAKEQLKQNKPVIIFPEGSRIRLSALRARTCVSLPGIAVQKSLTFAGSEAGSHVTWPAGDVAPN